MKTDRRQMVWMKDFASAVVMLAFHVRTLTTQSDLFDPRAAKSGLWPTEPHGPLGDPATARIYRAL